MQFRVFNALLLSFSIGICFAATSTYDGKPGCKTLGEVGQNYRHFWDPLRYWRCIGLNMEAQSENCPSGTGFQQSLNRCVSWTNWRWESPQYPPSCPDGVMCLSAGDLQPLSPGSLRPANQPALLPYPGQSQSLQSSQAISSLRPLGSATQYLSVLESEPPIAPLLEPIKYPAHSQV